ncbi:MAG: hypothetical protein M0Q91_13390 [Methanoregula sp.]|jgi:hypothetical protein|nr:hypothetical protein [Methanoregula sp.]
MNPWENITELNLIVLDKRYYKESGTMMGSLYRIMPDGTLKRFDYGYLDLAIKHNEGIKVTKRPPTEEEIKYFDNLLEEKIIKWGKPGPLGFMIHEYSEDLEEALISEIGSGNIYIAGKGP